jgi:hypothetical protein
VSFRTEAQATRAEHRLPATLDLLGERLDVALGDRVAGREKGLVCGERDPLPSIQLFQLADALFFLVGGFQCTLQRRPLGRQQREVLIELLKFLFLGLELRSRRGEVGFGDLGLWFERHR